jgi:negative regulator of flagellin synthesis FlgM
MKIDPKALMMEINKLNPSNTAGVDGRRTERQDGSTSPAPNNAAARSANEARVDVSNEARTVQGILHNLAKTPDIDNTKVTRIKAALDEGRYQVDGERLADKIIASEQELKDQPE